MKLEFWIPIFLTAILAIWNYFQQRKLQELKRISEKQLHIHRLQFDKEFEIYLEIWKELVELRDISIKLRPEADMQDPKLSYEEVIKQRLDKAIKIGNSIIQKVENNRPFYSSEIYESLNEVIKLVRTEITEVQFGDRFTKEYWEEGKINISKLLSTTDVVCEKIRNRIGIAEK
jgi:hypothetical protein